MLLTASGVRIMIVRGIEIPKHLEHLSREALRNLIYLFRQRT